MAVWSDVRHAVRSLRRARGFTAVAAGTLAASLALAVAVMAVVNAYLLRGLPYPESDRLFNVRSVLPGQDFPQGLAALAVVLSLVGICGVIAYAVRQRGREIAIRMAVGAAGRDVLAMFLRQGAGVLACGLTLGVLAAIGLGRVLETELFGVQPAEPAVLATMTLVFALCGMAAIAWPAQTAAGMDPAAALKD